MEKVIATIDPTAPFDFNLTAGYHTYFQGRYGADSLSNGVYRRLLDLGDKLALASVTSAGSVAAPELVVELQGQDLTQDDAERAAQQVAWLLGAGQDLSPFYALAEADPTMSAIVGRFYGLHLPHTATVFEALVLAILGQQIATSVARIIRTLMIETYGLRQTIDGETYHIFPRPEALLGVPLEELRRMKLSQRKAEYVQGIARAALDSAPGGLESLRLLPDDEVVKQVTALRGVGHWTAQWVLIRALDRPDSFPTGDLALRRTVSRLYFGGADLTDAELEEFSRRWAPWRTYATVYLFTALRAGMAQG